MRVIAGKYRSRVLKGPGVLKLRPTSDRLRETFFNVLGPAIESSLFIDAFAGTGAMGIEALSRGASEAIFLESYGKAVQLIQRNLESLEIRNAELIHADVIAGLEKMATRRGAAVFIFVDRPYEKNQEYARVLDFLDGSDLIAPRGVVIVEHYFKTTLPMRLDRLEGARVLQQGGRFLLFFRLAAAA